MQNNLYQAFKESCQAHADAVCIRYKKKENYESLTFAQLEARVGELADVLRAKGIRPGQRVAFLLTSGPQWPAAFFACMALQAVAVPLDAQLSPEDLGGMLRHSRARLLLTEERFSLSLAGVLSGLTDCAPLFLDRPQERISGAPPRKGQSDFSSHKLAALFYTSGTTQEHKAVMLTHANLLANAASIRRVGILRSSDVILSLLPLHHTYPFMVTLLAPVLEGATVCYLPAIVPHELFLSLKENGVSVFVGVPQLYAVLRRTIGEKMQKVSLLSRWTTDRLMDLCAGISRASGLNVSKRVLKGLHEALGPQLRLLISGGAKLDPEVAQSFRRWGFQAIEGYGLTETSPVVTFNPPGRARFDSVGKALPDVSIEIRDPDEAGRGEIAIRGANVMLGYYRALGRTREVLRDGWFLTGDLGFVDAQGYLHLTGRSNELIVLPSGKNVNPEEVEAVYSRSEFIKEICVLHAESGSEASHLVAVIVPDEDRLKQKGHVNIHFKVKWEMDACAQKLPPYLRVKGFVLTGQTLPRTRLGKLMRYRIAQDYEKGHYKREADKEPSPDLTRFEESALQYLTRILKQPVHIDDHLELDLGLDSLGRIELLSALQDLVNVGIDDTLALELFQARTVRELMEKARVALPQSAFDGLLAQGETVFWPQVLSQPPREETLRRIKLRFDLFDRFVSFLEIGLLKIFIQVVFFLRVKGRGNIPADAPFVISSNHVTYLDAFFVIAALPFSLLFKTYFVGFGSIFNHPLLAWAVRFHRLIPIDASIDLTEALKACQYVLKQGKVLVYFPEGQRSADGGLKEFRKGIGILLKESGARVLPIYLKGAYKVWPRGQMIPVPAPVEVRIGNILELNELSSSSKDDPYVAIAESLREKTAALGDVEAR